MAVITGALSLGIVACSGSNVATTNGTTPPGSNAPAGAAAGASDTSAATTRSTATGGSTPTSAASGTTRPTNSSPTTAGGGSSTSTPRAGGDVTTTTIKVDVLPENKAFCQQFAVIKERTESLSIDEGDEAYLASLKSLFNDLAAAATNEIKPALDQLNMIIQDAKTMNDLERFGVDPEIAKLTEQVDEYTLKTCGIKL